MNTSTGSSRRSNSVASKERRRAKRSTLRVRADVTLPGDLTIVSHTIDISINGVSFDVPYELQVSQACNVTLDLKKFGGRPVDVVAIVRNCSLNSEGKFQAGLEFQSPPTELITVLAKAVC